MSKYAIVLRPATIATMVFNLSGFRAILRAYSRRIGGRNLAIHGDKMYCETLKPGSTPCLIHFLGLCTSDNLQDKILRSPCPRVRDHYSMQPIALWQTDRSSNGVIKEQSLRVVFSSRSLPESLVVSSPKSTPAHPPCISTFKRDKDKTVTQTIPSTFTGFIYMLKGWTFIGDNEFEGKAHHTLAFSKDGAETDKIQTKDEDAHFIVIADEPLREPIVQHGRFVMNTQEDIYDTFVDFRYNQNGF
ncbi:MAG: Pirin C-terminal cupin domain-containing protein [Linnemannia gamsii]|nr:MAG: Pirin C-terminal cupin domain-containing protein [Linnemannia gamsii]